MLPSRFMTTPTGRRHDIIKIVPMPLWLFGSHSTSLYLIVKMAKITSLLDLAGFSSVMELQTRDSLLSKTKGKW